LTIGSSPSAKGECSALAAPGPYGMGLDLVRQGAKEFFLFFA